jgi:hypothetical protein
MADEIFLYKALAEVGAEARRREIVAALKAKQIPTTSTEPPWMVKLSDIQTWIDAHPS